MEKPKIGKRYTFVRRIGDVVEHTDFTRWEDGSAGFEAGGREYSFEEHEDAWRSALATLQGLGFVELNEAKRQGLVAEDWEPT